MMSRTLLLACGNSLRGDDGVAPCVADCLRESDLATQIHSALQWTPELAEPISQAELVIFVDASASLQPGEIACMAVRPIYKSPSSLTHQTSPASLLALAEELYGKVPARAYLLTIGGASFEMGEGLSADVRRAVPRATERIRTLLAECRRGARS
jgi:hydrogenase maturation protease